MLLCCIIPSSLGKTNTSSRHSKKDFWRRFRGVYAKSQYTKYPSQSLSLALHYFPFASRFPLPPIHPCHLIRPLSLSSLSICLFFPFAFCLLVCWIACLSRWLKTAVTCVVFAMPTIPVLLPRRLLLLPMLNLVKLILLC